MRHPVKVHLCRCLRGGTWMTVAGLYAALRQEYAGERHFTEPAIGEHLKSLHAIGITQDRYVFGADGAVLHEWSLTPDGEARLGAMYPG